MRYTLVALGLLIGAVVPTTGCFNYIVDVCPACRTIKEGTINPQIPPPADGKKLKARIVLVPGAFGFGEEWKPLLKAIARRADLDMFVFDWPGPWKNPERSARALANILQKTLDGLPPETNTLVVFAHSAGGMAGDLAVRLLRVPDGKHVLLYGLDGQLKWRMQLPPDRVNDGAKTSALGNATTSDFAPYPPIPLGVTITHYVCKNPRGAKQVEADGTIQIRVGLNAGHNDMLGPAAVPVIENL